MRAIYKRELKSFFHSFVGWLFLAATLFLAGIYFTVYNIMSGYPTISYVLQSIVFLYHDHSDPDHACPFGRAQV